MSKLNLKHLRVNANLKQSDLAIKLNVTTRTIQRYESGQSEPNINQLITLADLFDVSIDYLVGRTDDPKRY